LPEEFELRLNDHLKDSANALLALAEDFDGEGSKRYSKAVVDRATHFVHLQAEALWNKHATLLTIPDLGPGPDGTIDLHWRTPSYELLVNIPADRKSFASFYGDDYGKMKLRGTLNPEEPNEGLLCFFFPR
jgi:hypothetical protein